MSAVDGSRAVLLHEQEVSVSLSSERHQETCSVAGDKAISKFLAKDVLNFICDTISDDRERLSEVESLKSSPLNLSKCKIIQGLIEKCINIIVVPAENNYYTDENGSTGCLISWKRTLDLRSDATVAVLGEERVRRLKVRSETSVTILTVSQPAFDALKRYTNSLQRPATVVRRSYGAIRRPPSPDRIDVICKAGRGHFNCCVAGGIATLVIVGLIITQIVVNSK